MINLTIPPLFVHFGVLFWRFHKNAPGLNSKMRLKDKGYRQKSHYSAALRWPPVCRGGEPVGRLAPAGPLDTSGARTIVSSRRSQRSAQVEGVRARACQDPSRSLGLTRPPSAPRRQRFDWVDCIRAAPGYQLSRRAHNAAFQAQCMECGARGSKEVLC